MNNQEFFNVLIGNPPPEVELEIEIRCREIQSMPDIDVKKHCLDLVKHTRLQDMLIVSALMRISDTETKLYKAETKLKQLRQKEKQSLFNKIGYVLFGRTIKKRLY
tara:strand:+ start:1606 stop:1923 length:318 start_codon:yes stop_codon:yes gene_type:complete